MAGDIETSLNTVTRKMDNLWDQSKIKVDKSYDHKTSKVTKLNLLHQSNRATTSLKPTRMNKNFA